MLTGPDISHHQGVVNFLSVRSAHDCVIMKATEGVSFEDSRYRANIVAARSAGLRVGAYHFLRREFSGRAQADHFLDKVGNTSGLLLVVDCETSASGTNPTLTTIKEFCQRVIERTGREPVLYTYNSWWGANIGTGVPIPCRHLWIARYRTKSRGYGAIPPVTRVFGWQYTSSGSCPGVAGNCDLNDFYVSASEWDAAAGSGSAPLPPPSTGDWFDMATKEDLKDAFREVLSTDGDPARTEIRELCAMGANDAENLTYYLATDDVDGGIWVVRGDHTAKLHLTPALWDWVRNLRVLAGQPTNRVTVPHSVMASIPEVTA